MLAFKIASRFLKSSKGQTILIILGIAVGVSVQVFIGTLIQGLQKSLVNKTVGNSSQITITSTNSGGTISDWREKVDKIKTLNTKIKDISPSVDFSASIDKDEKMYPISVRGFELSNAEKIYNIKGSIVSGSEPKNEDEVMIGTDLKNDISAKVGDNITIFTPDGSKKEVKIVGIYDLKSSSINDRWVITTMAAAQDIGGLEDKATTIEIQVNDVFTADSIMNDIKNIIPTSGIKISNWKASNSSLLSALNGQNASSIMIQIFVLISVILGITSVLAITVIQKSKQIGILKAMGIKDKVSSRIFLYEGLILGIFGATFGVTLGILWTYSFTKFVLNPDGTPVVPLYIDYKFIIFSVAIAIFSACIASIVPARKSLKLDPIEVIKNG